MKKIAVAVSLASLSSLAFAAPSLGSMAVLSAPNEPFKAEIAVQLDKDADLSQLRAGVLSRQARAGGARQDWERDATYRLESRGDSYVLLVESSKSVPDGKVELTVGVEDASGKADRDYAFQHSGKGWTDAAKRLKLSALMATAKLPTPTPSVAAAQPTEYSPGLKLSSDLHFVVPFADGRVRLGPKGREAVDRLAEVAVKAERIQIKGWAGGSDEQMRESMAFNRAYTVQYQLAKRGISKDALRIMKPALAIAELESQGVSTPQVVATLLANESENTIQTNASSYSK